MDSQQQPNLSPSDVIHPEVEVELGNRTYQLRWDNRALFRLQGFSKDMSVSGDYRQILTMVWSMLVGKHPFKDPMDLTDYISPHECLDYAQKVNSAVANGADNGMPGGEDGSDPLSRTGRSPGGGSD